MRNQNNRRNRRPPPPPYSSSFREPEITRYSHPIQTSMPCAEDMSWIRGTLACHSQLLSEILELLRSPESAEP